MRAQQQKPSAAQVAGQRMHHRQRKPGRNCRIHRVSALSQCFEPGVRRQVVYAHNHAVRGPRRLLAAVSQHIFYALLSQGING